MKVIVKSLAWLLLVSIGLVVLAFCTVYFTFRASLPELKGKLDYAQIERGVDIARDVQGIPTLHSESRNDIAFGLGFLHAQERFFQMDLLRRNSSGELSELFGDLALGHDIQIRKHQLRKRAESFVPQLDEKQRDLMSAYAEGVNAGLEQLGSKPFEYWLLGVEPKPWTESDTFMVLHSMYMDLQPNWNQQERSMAELLHSLPADWAAWIAPSGGEWDSPIMGGAYQNSTELAFPEIPLSDFQYGNNASTQVFKDKIQIGSNNWSVSGDRSPYQAGLVADDMHLGLRVPNIWYRASWNVPGANRQITGATLPGTPLMVVGSNEFVAWGFTNSSGDYHDSVLLQTNADESQYLTPKGWLDFGVEFEEVLIKDMDAKSVAVKTTIWGPVIGRAPTGEPMAMRWVLHDVEGSNMNLGLMETADTVQDALQIAAIAGTPGQNLNVVDHLGQQAWTIMGRLPNRVGFDGKLPVSWADGLVGWDGYLTAEDYPVWLNPESGRIWTANARIAADDALRKVGTGTYALGARQQQIRDVMLNQEQFTEQDFLDLQLDDRAVFLSRWQTVLLETLANSQHHLASEAFNLVESWGARADKDSQGYLLVKRFREAVVNNSVAEVLRWVDSNRQGDYFSIGHVDNFIEYPTWALVSQQPEQHLPVGYSTWADFLDAMAIQVMSNLVNNYGSLEQATWGNANKLKIVHPLASAIPVLGDSLNMPATPSSGDTYMPFVQSPTHGASQRFAVAPGHEESGFFHMATGQSSHPLSSYYRLGHDDWLNGEFSAFLPGETKWTLSLNAE